MQDLWPDDIGVAVASDIRTPRSILREQANALYEKTSGIVQGSIETRQDGAHIEHVFVILAPALNYRYELVGLIHNISEIYPVRIDASSVLKGESVFEVYSEEQLIEALQKVFSSDRSKGIVKSLIAQSRE